jgi:hypothetical protein
MAKIRISILTWIRNFPKSARNRKRNKEFWITGKKRGLLYLFLCKNINKLKPC